MSQNTSHTLQQSLVQSIRDSRSRSNRPSSHSLTQSMMSISRSSQLSEVSSNSTLNQSDSIKETIKFQLDDDLNKNWLMFYNNLQSQFAHYFFEIQFNLRKINTNINTRNISNIHELLLDIKEKLKSIQFGINRQIYYLLTGFAKQVQSFDEMILNLKVYQGIVKSTTSNLNELQILQIEEQFNFMQESYSKFVMIHFFIGESDKQIIDDSTPISDFNDNDDSFSSGFSDENNEVEEFETGTALELVLKIKNKLKDESALESCRQYEFIVDQDTGIDLQGFFSQTMYLQQISDYETMCFLLHTGIIMKLLNFKIKYQKQQSILKYFMEQFYIILNKCQNFPSESLEEMLNQNTFDLQHIHISRRQYYSSKNLFRDLISSVLTSKINRWKQIHLSNEEQLNLFASQLSQLQPHYEKHSLRKFCLRFSMPLSKLETQILSWDKGVQLFGDRKPQKVLQTTQDKLRDTILRVYTDSDDILNILLEVDRSQSGKLNYQQFQSALKTSSIPFTLKEIKTLFNTYAILEGKYTIKGIQSEYFININDFIHNIYGVELSMKSHKSEIIDQNNHNSQEISQQENISFDNQNITNNKYNELNTLRLMVKSLQYKNKNLNDQYKLIHLSVDKLQQDIEHLLDEIFKKDTQIYQLQQKIQEQHEIVDEQIRQKGIENIENIKSYSNIVDVNQNKQLIKEKKWQQERNSLIRELKQKEIQIDQYRLELEGLVNELHFIKTQRV